jgi:beta-lactamase regulating signal transducer with metallopeptidase domain
VAAAVLTVAAVAVAVAFRHRARALAESYRRAARLNEDGTVVVQRGTAVEAYALPGWPGRIVVSGRLLEALDEPGRAALLAHERAHLAARHHLFTTVAHLAAAANPVLLPLARAVDYTVERWADEHAARVTGDRRLVAVTIVRAGSRRVSVAWAGPVPRRVAALLGPPPRSRALLLAAAVLIVLLTGLSAVEATRELHALLELAQAGR